MPKDKNGLTLKLCSDCSKTSDEVDFHMRKIGKPGYYSKRCIDCQNHYKLQLKRRTIEEINCEICNKSSNDVIFDFYSVSSGNPKFYPKCKECKKHEAISERICKKCEKSSNIVEFRTKNYNTKNSKDKEEKIYTNYAKLCKECEKIENYEKFLKKHKLEEIFCRFCEESSLIKYFSHYNFKDKVLLYDFCFGCKDKNLEPISKICNICYKTSKEVEFSTRKIIKKNSHEIVYANICKICVTKERKKEYNTLDKKLKAFKKSAIDRDYEWKLTDKEAIDFFNDVCYYCGKESIEGEDMNGIDRVVNSIGYINDNCVSCCGMCNNMKRAYDQTDFIQKCIEIAKLHSKESN
jgi:hypothetical protein